MPGWDRWDQLVREEFKQSAEEGKPSSQLEELRCEYESAGGDASALESILSRLVSLPVAAGFPYVEPDELADIRACHPDSAQNWTAKALDDSELLDRLEGAWLGRCAGCVLGKPVEGMGLRGVSSDGVRPWRRIKRFLSARSPSEWPLSDYFPGHSPAESEPGIGAVSCPASTREHIAFVESDDDIRYSVLGLILMREKGSSFSSWDVACNWIRRLPYASVCTAETQAYLNLVSGHEFHAGSNFGPQAPDIDWSKISTARNPYREWIGAQIRVDAYAYAAAGNPGLAAELAWRDARISHVKNGIYGAMFCAAMIAAAFATDEPGRIVAAGLDQIPSKCRLAEAVRRTVAIVESHGCRADCFEEILDEIHAALESYATVHTIPNAAICVMAILLSGGDFHLGITLAVMGGWDTDCNGATVGSVVGAINGRAKAPAHWTGRLNDTLRSEIFDYHPIAISECARQTLEVAKAIRG